MATLTIRKTGNAVGISIPKKILKLLNLDVGDELDFDIKHDKIILKPHQEDESLEQLLAESEKSSFKLTSEDKQWLGSNKGKEI